MHGKNIWQFLSRALVSWRDGSGGCLFDRAHDAVLHAAYELLVDLDRAVLASRALEQLARP